MSDVKELINKADLKKLMQYDQLRKSIEAGECFENFKEKNIEFPPTYKFDVNTHTYDSSKKKRIPSYCDRILYKLENSFKSPIIECKPLEYNSLRNLDQSDHKPVYGMFLVNVSLLTKSFF